MSRQQEIASFPRGVTPWQSFTGIHTERVLNSFLLELRYTRPSIYIFLCFESLGIDCAQVACCE